MDAFGVVTCRPDSKELFMPRSIRRFLVFFLFLGCSAMPPAQAPVPASLLAVANGRIQLAARDTNPSAYFVIQNRSAEPRMIIGASCAGCEEVEIVRAVLREGAMASKILVEWEIPAGGAVAFAPRGLSLSLVGAKDLVAGDIVRIELRFANGENLPFDAEVRD